MAWSSISDSLTEVGRGVEVSIALTDGVVAIEEYVTGWKDVLVSGVSWRYSIGLVSPSV
jgi:hypothetical protein